MRRGLGVLLIAAAVALAVGGSGAFSSASVDRGTTVSVADDSNAYIGVENCTITNNAGQGLDVRLVSDSYTQRGTLSSGESINANVSSETTTISAEGASISAEMVRSFDCADEPSIDGPLNGTAKTQGNSSQ